MSLLEVRALTTGYRGGAVLGGVDLDVGPYEIVAVVGPSGSGKSTLLGAISGLVPVASGSVRLHGRDVAGLAAEDIMALGLVHVPERRRLFAGLTVRENLLLGGWRAGRRDIGRVLEMFPTLVGRLETPSGALSGGEQQLCAIARGLMADPAIMLIDEFSLGLAPVMAHDILVRLADIAAGGTSLVLVDQDAATALSVAERAYILESGFIVASGPSGKLLADHALLDRYLD